MQLKQEKKVFLSCFLNRVINFRFVKMEETDGGWINTFSSTLEIDSVTCQYTKIIGFGSFGICYLYENQTENLRYAVKKLWASNQFQRQEMAVHEVELLRKCQSDNVVRLFEALLVS